MVKLLLLPKLKTTPQRRKLKHLVENLSALTLVLSAEQRSRIDALDGTEGNPYG